MSNAYHTYRGLHRCGGRPGTKSRATRRSAQSNDAKEVVQSFGGLFGSLFREKVAGLERESLNIVAPGLPKRDGSRFLDVPSIKRPSRAPQGQERADDPTPAGTIRLVMLAVDGGGGSILLTDRMCVSGISKSLSIGRTNLRREHSRGRAPSPERIIDDGFRGRRQDAFWKWLSLSEQRPRPEGERELCVGAGPDRLRRQDVENGEPVDAMWMVKSHPIGDATATIVSRNREARKSKPLHNGHHVLRHGSLRIWCMVRRGDRAAAAPVAAKIGADDRQVASKKRRHAAPQQVCLRKAVQQEDRRPGSVDRKSTRLNSSHRCISYAVFC